MSKVTRAYVWGLGLLSDVLWLISEWMHSLYITVSKAYFKGEAANAKEPMSLEDKVRFLNPTPPPPLYMKDAPPPPVIKQGARARRRAKR